MVISMYIFFLSNMRVPYICQVLGKGRPGQIDPDKELM